MKAVILAGGLGTRLSEETSVRPKPMIEIGGRPMLWHIMKIYSAHGITDFVICLGYKGYVIKEYFANYHLHTADVTFDLAGNSARVHRNGAEPWTVTLVETGERTMTGGRLRRAAPYLDEETFCATYGDGLSDVDVGAVIEHHRTHQNLATITGVQPPGRFGALEVDGPRVTSFKEKPNGDGGWINGGFFVLDRGALDYIDADQTVWEREPLERMASKGQVGVYRHSGFWHPLDTLRDKSILESLWSSPSPPWKRW